MTDDPTDADTGEDDADADATESGPTSSEDDTDPFDALGADEYRDQGGNPFETLGGSSGDDRRPESTVDEPAGPPVDDGRRTRSEPDGRRSGPDADEGSNDSRALRSSTESEATGAGADGTEREDPFTYLGDQRRRQQGSDDRDRDRDPDPDPDHDRDGVRSDVGIPSGDPLADLGDDDGSPGSGAGAGSFEEVDTGDVDPDDVWKRLVGGQGSTSTTVASDEEADVPKHAYCETCEYFSPPPEVHCTHEGTTILEFVDMETVRVVNCPVVAERRELGYDE